MFTDLVAACFGMGIAHTKQNRLIKQSAYGKYCGHNIVMLPVGILCCQMNLSASCTKLSTFLPLKCTLVHRSFRNKGAAKRPRHPFQHAARNSKIVPRMSVHKLKNGLCNAWVFVDMAKKFSFFMVVKL